MYPISTLMVSHKHGEVCALQQTKDETGWKDKNSEVSGNPASTDHLRPSLPGVLVFYPHVTQVTPPTSKSLSVNCLIPVNGEPTKPDKQLQVKQEQHLKDQKFNVTFEK